MPIMGTGIQSQAKAEKAALYIYPAINESIGNTEFIDQFQRESITPTGFPAIYATTSNDSNGVFSIVNGNSLNLQTDNSAIGDDANCRFTVTQQRIPQWNGTDSRSMIEYDLIIITSGAVADTEWFAGIMMSGLGVGIGSALSNLPTTDEHIGAFFDASASGNIFLSSGNGSAQVTTDTGEVTAPSTLYRINILWNGVNSATVSLYTGTSPNINTLVSTQTITDLNSAQTGQMHIFVQTEATAAKDLRLAEWRYKID